ncbi:MAG: hypothetical protein ACI9HK_003127 [Pirellulaceae bacterium]|jgi:uncharacterized protein (TIGR02996 family)
MATELENPLYQEILANPGDLEPRLVFADWLEEHGDPRCEVIRLQYQIENNSPKQRGYTTLKAKERKLFKQVGGFGSIREITTSKEEYRAGFVEQIELTPTRFLKHAERIFARAPVRRVRLKGICKSFDKIANLSQLSRLCEMVIRNSRIDQPNFRAFIRSPHLTGLEKLSIHSDEITSPGRDLSETELLDHITALFLSGTFVDDTTTAHVANRAVALQQLSLRSQLSDASLRSIAGSAGLRSLELLKLGASWGIDNGFTESALRDFGQSEFVLPLKSLNLQGVQRGFERAFEEPRFSKLESLSIRWHVVQDGAFALLLSHLKNITYLDFTQTTISDDAMIALAKNPLLANLEKFYASGNRITLKGIEAVLDSQYFNKKTKFYLGGNPLGKADIIAIKHRAGKTFGNFNRDYEFRAGYSYT